MCTPIYLLRQSSTCVLVTLNQRGERKVDRVANLEGRYPIGFVELLLRKEVAWHELSNAKLALGWVRLGWLPSGWVGSR